MYHSHEESDMFFNDYPYASDNHPYGRDGMINGPIAVKYLHYVKNSSKWGGLLRFFAYICHSIDDFACLVLQH